MIVYNAEEFNKSPWEYSGNKQLHSFLGIIGNINPVIVQ
jgi:hypothetical protein